MKPDFGADWRVAYIYALKEDYGQVLNWIDQFIAVAPSQGLKAEGYRWKGFYYAWLGRFDEAIHQYGKAEELAIEIENEQLRAYSQYGKGWIYLEKGDMRLSQESFESYFHWAERELPKYSHNHKASLSIISGYIHVKKGDIDSARRQLEEAKISLAKVSTDAKERLEKYWSLLHSEILLAQGSIAQSKAAWEDAIPTKIPSFLSGELFIYNMPFLKDTSARAHLQKGELDKAIAEYERLISFDPDSKDRRLIHPLYHYRLAKLYEQKEWMGKAIEQYQKFLALWGDAVDNLPEPKDARSRLKELST
jgi:tetratricopeptide (TPR) repeat protein